MSKVAIMIVEDDAIAATITRDMLERLGYLVAGVAASGDEALDIAASHRLDLALLDIKLRGSMDGIELARQIQNRYDVPIIYLTAFADAETIMRAKSTDPFGYVVKPFDVSGLQSAIEIALYKHEMQSRLRESEAHYRAVTEIASDYSYAFLVRPDGALRREWATGAFGRILGFSLDEIDDRRGWNSLLHPDDWAEGERRLDRLIAGDSDVGEFRFLTKTGEIRWLRDRAQPIWDDDEKRVVRIIGAVQDITNRVQAHQALQQRAAELEARNRELDLLLATSQVMFQSLDRAEVLERLVSSLMRRAGVQHVQIFLDPKTDGTITCVLASSAQTTEVRWPNRTVSIKESLFLKTALETGQSGIIFDVRFTDQLSESEKLIALKNDVHSMLILPMVYSGKVSGLLSLGRRSADAWEDAPILEAIAAQFATVIENIKYYEHFATQATQFAALYQLSHALSADLNSRRILYEAVSSLGQIFDAAGCTLGLVDRDAGVVIFHAIAGERSDVLQRFTIPLDRGFVGWVVRNDQPVLVGDAHADPRWDSEADQISGFVTRSVLCVPLRARDQLLGVLELVSGQPNAFDEDNLTFVSALATTIATALENAQLFEKLEASLERLRSTQAQLVQAARLSAVGELAAGVAHQINNPLTTVLGDAEILLQEIPPDDPLYESVKAISRAGYRARSVVQDLLGFARQQAWHVEAVNINDSLQRVHRLIGSQARRHNSDLQLDLADELPLVKANTHHLEEAWINLLLNARDAIPGSRPGVIRVATSWVRNENSETGVIQVVFEDNGVGILEENLDRIFDLFFTTKELSQGIGLGLAFTRDIINRHGGKISVTSKPGEGARFVVTLPALPPLEAKGQPEANHSVEMIYV